MKVLTKSGVIVFNNWPPVKDECYKTDRLVSIGFKIGSSDFQTRRGYL